MPVISFSPNAVIELPHYVFSSLAQLQPIAHDKALAPLLEQVVRSVGGDSGFLLDMTREGTGSSLVCQWTRPGLSGRPLDLSLLPTLLRRTLAGETIVLARVPHDLPEDAAEDREQLTALGIKFLMIVPVITADRVVAVAVQNITAPAAWDDDVAKILRFTAEIFAFGLSNHQVHQELERAKADIARLTLQLESQSRVFKEEILTVHDFDEIVGSSPAFVRALEAVREVAPTDTTTLLLGETGTGKELFARALHDRSPRRQRPFVCVNCAALPASLIESELFGHERGAFTGAISTRQGRFELADHGTLFLDEVGDLPLELQPKLLRVLQEREFERVGSSARRKVDVRVIAATHEDLRVAVAEGRFRADLYYRLSVFPITLPPLRERREDIPHLVWFLINQRQRRLHRRITEISRATMNALVQYQWPGNVRELENVIERAMIRSPGGTLQIDETLIAEALPAAIVDGGTLEALERAHIEATLAACHGRINGPGNTAERLGLHPNTLRFRMKKLGIVRKGGAGDRDLVASQSSGEATCPAAASASAA